MGGRKWVTSKSVGRNFRFLDSLEDTRPSRKDDQMGISDPKASTHLPEDGGKYQPWRSIFMPLKTERRQNYPHIVYHIMV